MSISYDSLLSGSTSCLETAGPYETEAVINRCLMSHDLQKASSMNVSNILLGTHPW